MKFNCTPIQPLKYNDDKNKFYIKRDDLLPFSFGGNKVRIAEQYFLDMECKKCDCIIAYGSSQSNLCRVIANMARKKGVVCYVISSVSDNEKYVETNNSILVKLAGAKIITCSKSKVAETLEELINKLKEEGHNPYYIYGNTYGKGNEKIGTRAYYEAYDEIKQYEDENKIKFDYIFHASGTGTTQSGLICGKLKYDDDKEIVGISVARGAEQGRRILIDNVSKFTENIKDEIINNSIVFEDKYILEGYGKYNEEIISIIQRVLIEDGIPLDRTYTGKAFWGMTEYLKEKYIKGKNILFIHTGGLPLFFDKITDLSRD